MDRPLSNLSDYRSSIEALNFGKRVGPFLYIHMDGLDNFPNPIQAFISYASEIANRESFEFNIVKIGTKQATVSLLNYPGFWRQAFPLLAQSAKLDLDSHELHMTDYRQRKNQPVLHRKELLLPPGHSHFEKFSSLTSQAEELGLFKNPKSIGLSKGWRRTLAKANVKIVGHMLQSGVSEESIDTRREDIQIDRHKSALHRQHLSMPLQSIERYGYLNGDYSVFDYGCGRGDDLELLNCLDVPASGWDPYFRADAPKDTCDIVNLGYVVNVIENRGERDRAVKESFDLTKKFLIVSALIGNPEYSGPVREHSDGVVTSRGTFQKYFLPDELENYVRGLLNVPVLPAAHGVVLAFKSDEEADRFRARRAGARRIGSRGSRELASDLFLLDEQSREVLMEFWGRCVLLGREPVASELTESESLEPLGLSPTTAFKFLSEKFGLAEIEESAFLRKEELLVQFALGYFDGRVYFKYLSEDVQKDISEFFEGFSNLRLVSKELLFSVSDTDLLMHTSRDAAADELGYMLSDDTLQLHVSIIERLPPVLQVYVGCAIRMLGGVGRATIVKIHLKSGKVSLMTYDDFEGQAVPFLIERIKVNLWARSIEYFDYIGGFAPPPLLMKSLFLPEEDENFDAQARFDGQLMRAGLFDIDNPHPSRKGFEASLDAKGLRIVGFELVEV